jgi:Mg2+ and Co2+ transporter CorA
MAFVDAAARTLRIVITRVRRYRRGAAEVEEIPLDSIHGWSGSKDQLLWVDIVGDADRETEALAEIDDRLGLDGKLRESSERGPTGIRFSGRAIGITVIGRGGEPGEATAGTPLHLVAARDLVVSLHPGPMAHLDEPVEIVAGDPRFGRLDAGTFLGLLLDGMLDGYFREVEVVEQAIDQLDTRALAAKRVAPLTDDLVAVRRRIATLRHELAPQREVFAALVRPVEEDPPSPIGWPWSGLNDRLERALDAIEQVRDQLLGSFDLVMTRTGQQTNDVMRVLTVISSVLLPSVVIAGVMGMNFKVAFFDDPSNFLVVLGAMTALALGILGVARLRGWI